MTLHHSQAGPADGPALLLGGSLGTTLAMWRPQVAELASSRRVVAFDHRGHGGSPVPPGPYAIEDLARDVLALMDHLALERVAYCGLSIGGMVGMWLAANAPERLDRLVLLCTAAHLPATADAYRERAALVRGAGTVEPVADAVVERWLTPGWAAAHPGERDRLRAMVAATPAEGYAGCCEAVAAMDLREELPQIAAPTLVVAGAQDPATPPEHGERIAAAISGARFETVSPAAHLASVEQAGPITRLITHHLEAP